MQEQNYWTRLGRGAVSGRRFMVGGATAVAGLAAAGVIGCNDSSNENQGTTPQTVGEPKRGGKLAFSYAIQPPHLDPHQTTSAGVGGAAGTAYSRLVRYKVTEMAKALITEGDLAEKIEQPQPESYIFTLRKGVKWHNIAPVNGREFTANDIIYTFTRQNAMKVNASFTEGIDKMTAINDYQLRIDLKRPNADFLLNIASTRVPIIAHEVVETRGDLKQAPVIGTGAWVMESYDPNGLTKMVRNPNYFRQGLPYADELTFALIRDPQTQQAALRTKEILSLSLNSRIAQQQLAAGRSDYVRWANPLVGSKNLMWMPTFKGPTQSQAFRQGVMKGINRQELIQAIEGGAGFVSAGVRLPDMSWGLSESELNTYLAKDVTRAKALMTQAGTPSWNVTLNAGPTQLPSTLTMGELVAGQLKEISVNIANVTPTGSQELLANMWGRGEFDLLVAAQTPLGVGDSDLTTWYKSTSSQNGAKLNDAQLDAMIERQATLTNLQDRIALIKDIQRRILELGVVTPLYAVNNEGLAWNNLKNWYGEAAGFENSMYEIAWLE